MFKFTGCVITVASISFLFCRKVMEKYFTYKFLDETVSVTEQIILESGTNISYDCIFSKIGFDKMMFFEKVMNNLYVNKKETNDIYVFFDNMGRRDRESEMKYIFYNLESMKRKRDMYYRDYCENRKTHIVCGVSAGLFIIIFLI